MPSIEDDFLRCVTLWREATATEAKDGRFLFRPAGAVEENDPASEEDEGWWELLPPKLMQDGVFVKDAQQLALRTDTRFKCPERFYVADDDYLYPQDARVALVPGMALARYFAITAFIRLLEGIADHVYKDQTQALQLVFLQGEKLLIPVEYQLEQVPDTLDPQAWQEQIDGMSDMAAKGSLFKTLLIEYLGDVEEPQRFGSLLRQAAQLFERFKSRYETYVAQQSAQTVLDELAAKKLGWIGDIHKAVSDLNAQALGVPIAILLGASRLTMDPAMVWIDWVIAAGLLVFALLLHRSVGLQSARLESLKSALDAEKALMQAQYKSFTKDIEATFDALDSQVGKARSVLLSYQVAGWGLGAMAVLFSSWVSCLPAEGL